MADDPDPKPRTAAPGQTATQRAGFTLLELMIVIGIVSVLGAMAVPTLGAMVARHRLQSAAHHLQADVALARHEAARRGRTVHLAFRPGARWCYALSLDTPVDCAATPPPPGLIKRVQAEDHPQVLLLSAEPMVLEGGARLPMTGQPQAVLGTPDGARIALRLGPLGRASLCAEAGPPGQLPRCPPKPAGG